MALLMELFRYCLHLGKSEKESNYSCILISATLDYIQNDEGVLPRIAVIGVSGLAGIVLGYKGK